MILQVFGCIFLYNCFKKIKIISRENNECTCCNPKPSKTRHFSNAYYKSYECVYCKKSFGVFQCWSQASDFISKYYNEKVVYKDDITSGLTGLRLIIK